MSEFLQRILRPYTKPRRGGRILKKDCSGTYFLGVSHDPKDAVIMTNELAKYYVLGEYEKIFPDFDAGSEFLNTADYGIIQIIIRHEIVEAEDDYIEGGVYMFDYVRGDLIIVPFPYMGTDKYIEMNNNTNVLLEDINKFFSSEDLYRELGIKYRRNALIYGPPGTGKTFSILQAVNEQVETNDALVFFIPSSLRNMEDVFMYSEVFSDRKVIFLIEEITERAKNDVETLLNFLDGELSWENSYVIATTNYPEELDLNIIDRPGRFDTLLQFDNPTEDERRKYFEHMLGQEVDDSLIEMTDGFSFTYLKEIVVKSKLYGIEPIDVINEGIERKRLIKNSFRKSPAKFGF